MVDIGNAIEVAVVREVPGQLRVLRLRRADADTVAAAGRALGTPLPTEPNFVADGPVRCLWIGPGEWMLAGALPDRALLDHAIATAPAAHLADIGEGVVTYLVTGAAARDLLAKGCTLDLHPAAFGFDRCAQTALAQTFITIERAGPDAFRLFADRGHQHHLDLWFEDALIEFKHGDHH